MNSRPVTAWLPILGLLAGLACAPSLAAAQPVALFAPEEGQIRALLIGIDAYRYVRPLKGAVSDARDIEGALRRSGINDLTVLVDQQASRDAVIGAIEGLVQRTTRGDLVMISIAGHGAQEPERVKGSQPDGMDTVFLLPDFATTTAGSRQRIIGTEFNHFLKRFEDRGARVLFIADTCHGGGLTRDVDPRAGEISYRQVPLYRIPNDAHVPISTGSEAFLTELDFEKTAFLAAVDRKTKAPEVRIPGVSGYRGALSYALARALEGAADTDRDGKVTLKELFGYVRQVVYQLSDQRQNAVTLNSPHRSIDREVAFQMTRAVKIVDAAPEAKPAPASPRPRPPSPLRCASRRSTGRPRGSTACGRARRRLRSCRRRRRRSWSGMRQPATSSPEPMSSPIVSTNRSLRARSTAPPRCVRSRALRRARRRPCRCCPMTSCIATTPR